ncbi:MAG TPA: FKBP-type peptidyl-prolyl cis-trans isomerase [Phnomibacter sp.]|nr:FKBP-type peptidyl-prolyl cis-trans isomerase [Phnomibacter sp.]
MKRLVSISLVSLLAMSMLAIASCKKEKTCKNQDPALEETVIQEYITKQGLTVTKHPKGLYYQILNAGGPTKPNMNSVVYVTYKGTLLDGTVFDSQSNPGRTGFILANLIEAWRIGIPMMGKGGSMKMVLPSALGYGCNGSGETIPENAPLYFEIALVDFF